MENIKKSRLKRKSDSINPIVAVIAAVLIFFVGQILGYLVFALFYSVVSTLHSQIAYGIGGVETLRNNLDSLTNLNSVISLSPSVMFLQILISSTVTLWLLYSFVRLAKLSKRTLGLSRKPKWRYLQYAFITYAVYFASYIFVSILVTNLLPSVDLNQEQQLPFAKSTAGMGLLFVFLSLVVLPPLLEEILMRGFLYGSLRLRLKVLPAALITSVLFAAAHLQSGSAAPLLWAAAIDTFILSMLLVYLREKTGSVWPAVMLHGLKNMVAFTLLFIFKAG